MEDHLPRLHVLPHKSGDSGSDLVQFEALDDPGVGHTIIIIIFFRFIELQVDCDTLSQRLENRDLGWHLFIVK